VAAFEIFWGCLLIGALLFVPGRWIYLKYFAPQYEVRVKVLKKESSYGAVRSKYGYRPYNSYWAEFQIENSDEVMTLGMNVDLYTDVNEGQRGLLTYRKGYAVSFRRFKGGKKR
jgi:hypothetical protein